MKQLSTVQELVNAPVPEKTDTYVPIPNRQVIETVRGTLGNSGFNVLSEKYKTNRKTTQMFGAMEVESGNQDYRMAIAFRNSYDKTMSFGVAVGAQVDACSNLELSRFRRLRKHTTNVMDDFHTYVHEAVENIETEYQKIMGLYDQMKLAPVSDEISLYLLGKLFVQEKLINTTQVNLIKKKFQERMPKNGYDFHMDLTEALKLAHPRQIIDDHLKAIDFTRNEILTPSQQ